MSTDSGWGDYLSTDTTALDATATSTFTDYDASSTPAFEPIEPVVEPIVEPVAEPIVEPVVPESTTMTVESELTGATSDQDWSDWHGASGDSWATSAQDYVDYAQENLAAGNIDIANSAMDTAANHASIADANYTVADDYSAQVDTHLETAAAELAPYDTTSYDASSTSYDSSTYDATTYDASTSYDTTSYDSGSSFDSGTSYDIAE